MATRVNSPASRADRICASTSASRAPAAGDLPGRDGIDELVVGEDLLEQPAHLSPATLV
jgi:hypothetical protein